jgi:hypothetical protein
MREKINNKIIIIFWGLFLEIAFSAKADLISRLDGQAVYDSGFNITWLANANAGLVILLMMPGQMTLLT